MTYVVKWATWGYVPRLNKNAGYPSDPRDRRVKAWKTLRGVQIWLSRRDPTWASTCVIERLEP